MSVPSAAAPSSAQSIKSDTFGRVSITSSPTSPTSEHPIAPLSLTKVSAGRQSQMQAQHDLCPLHGLQAI